MNRIIHATYAPDRLAFHRRVTREAHLLLEQHAQPDQRAFIHPLVASDGVGMLTENAPAHHPWQHGLYVGLNDVNGVGFWTERRHRDPEHDGTFHPYPLEPPHVEGATARWVAVSMPVAARPAASCEAGVAIMDHSGNPEHPVPWRVDNQLGIGPSRSIAGAWHLTAGETSISRYRVLVFCGPVDAVLIERSWRAYAATAQTAAPTAPTRA